MMGWSSGLSRLRCLRQRWRHQRNSSRCHCCCSATRCKARLQKGSPLRVEFGLELGMMLMKIRALPVVTHTHFLPPDCSRAIARHFRDYQAMADQANVGGIGFRCENLARDDAKDFVTSWGYILLRATGRQESRSARTPLDKRHSVYGQAKDPSIHPLSLGKKTQCFGGILFYSWARMWPEHWRLTYGNR